MEAGNEQERPVPPRAAALLKALDRTITENRSKGKCSLIRRIMPAVAVDVHRNLAFISGCVPLADAIFPLSYVKEAATEETVWISQLPGELSVENLGSLLHDDTLGISKAMVPLATRVLSEAIMRALGEASPVIGKSANGRSARMPLEESTCHEVFCGLDAFSKARLLPVMGGESVAREILTSIACHWQSSAGEMPPIVVLYDAAGGENDAGNGEHYDSCKLLGQQLTEREIKTFCGTWHPEVDSESAIRKQSVKDVCLEVLSEAACPLDAIVEDVKVSSSYAITGGAVLHAEWRGDMSCCPSPLSFPPSGGSYHLTVQRSQQRDSIEAHALENLLWAWDEQGHPKELARRTTKSRMAEWTKLVRQFLSNLGGDAPLSSDSVDFASQLWYRVLRHARSSGELTAAIRFLAVLDSSLLERLHIFDDSGAVIGNNISHATKLGIFIKWLKEHRDLNADVRLEEASKRFSLNEEDSCTSMILCACELGAYVIQRNSCRKLASAVKEAGAEALLSWYLLREDTAKSIDNMVHSIAKLQRLEKTCEAVGVLKVASTVLEKKLHFSIGDVAIAALQFYKELPLDEDERRDPVFRLEPGSLEPAGLSDEGEGMFPRDLSPLRWCVRAEMESATAAVCICWSRCHALGRDIQAPEGFFDAQAYPLVNKFLGSTAAMRDSGGEQMVSHIKKAVRKACCRSSMSGMRGMREGYSSSTSAAKGRWQVLKQVTTTLQNR
eukprot:g1823.t1